MVKIEKESSYKKLNGTMSGEEFRQWRANLYDEAAGYTDESASSLADYFDDVSSVRLVRVSSSPRLFEVRHCGRVGAVVHLRW